MKSALIGLLANACLIASVTVGGPKRPGGADEVSVDLPADQRIRNIGSKVDGAGMCVTSSVEMGARWQGLDEFRGFRDWCALQPGGCYPGKLARQIAAYARARGIDAPAFVQWTDGDDRKLDQAIKTGRCVAVTYSGRDGVRYRGPIAHMVCLVYLDADNACLLDNNAIGESELLWMSRAEFLSRWRGMGGGWGFCWLAPAPPPVVHSAI